MLNKAAHDDVVDNAQTVELLYDRDRHAMALRATDASSLHAYAVRNGSKRGPGQAMWEQPLQSLCASTVPGMGVGQTAWLVIAAGDDREHRGHDGYDDLPDSHYSWDEKVDYADELQEGDIIVLWDKHTLLGASVIQRITTGRGLKPANRCPDADCGSADLKVRSTKEPPWRCGKCKGTFTEPTTEYDVVKTYQSHHSAGWVDLRGGLDGDDLRKLCVLPKSQQSLRRLRWEDFRAKLALGPMQGELLPLDLVASRIAGGHRNRTVRVRVGQAEFRKKLLKQMNVPVCAFTGPAPLSVLEASHLYSFAKEGEHYEDAGLLMRRDIHALFDRGDLAVNPAGWTIDVAPQIRTYEAYGPLHGQCFHPLHVHLKPRQKKWLRQHWDQHRRKY